MRLRNIGIFLALLLPCEIAAAEPTQTQPAPSEPEIVVTGRVKDVLRNFVQSLSKVGPTGQIARWDQIVCPTVIGIDSAQARFMEQHILDVGRSVRLRPGGQGCTTSLIVGVTSDPGGSAASLIRAYPVDLRTEGLANLKSFATSSEAMRWISVSIECGGTGCELPNSRLTKATKPTLQDMIIVVDANRISGYSLGELADYVALVGLTNPPANAVQNSRSMVSMFHRSRTAGAAHQPTSYDRAFLGGLYNIRLEDPAGAQRATITTHMKRELEKPSSVDPTAPQ
jgi:hypothetical protein